ncbi:hypothetical protein AB0D14_31410 [Streptomyces sp. NPDC048484]|uniref:hypothetical protein n=1 Tax=Streptomyces sp. NPDC048484 TaxID=3155146 RepID=UPI00342B675B
MNVSRKAVGVVLVNQRARRVGSIAGAAVAAVVGLAGCSDDADPAADKKSSANSSPTADAEKPGDDASASSSASDADQSTAEGAVAGWVTAVIKGQPEEACLLMAEPATGSKPAQVGSEAKCGEDAPERKEMEATLGQFRESFTPKPPTDDPKVEVTQPPATGDKVEVPADKITVDGQTLDKIVLSHSTGVTADQLDIKVESSKIKDVWYVTNLDFNIG